MEQYTTGTATVHSYSRIGLHCEPVEIEVDVAHGLPQFILVGLPDAAVSESRDRVRSEIKNSGFRFPLARVTVNLAPAHTKKIGSHFDLAIALGILAASGEVEIPNTHAFAGELALDGRLRAIQGALSLLNAVADHQRILFLPRENESEASFQLSTTAYVADSLSQIIRQLSGAEEPQSPNTTPHTTVAQKNTVVDLQTIKGQQSAKRALEVAAAGGHNIVFAGPPGVGKSMLAKAMPGLLPRLTPQEAMEVTMIHSTAQPVSAPIQYAPFQAPHHSISSAALIGGGRMLLPGHLSLAHHGVLFLDELPEFKRDALEALRQPLEEKVVHISRASGTATYPANAIVVAAYNPCPCGFAGSERQECICSAQQIARYTKKLSGPLLDRFDMKISVGEVDHKTFTGSQQEENSATVRDRVAAARRMQKGDGENSINQKAEELLHTALRKRLLSARGYDKAQRVAKTIARLDESQHIHSSHMAEALQYVLGFESK